MTSPRFGRRAFVGAASLLGAAWAAPTRAAGLLELSNRPLNYESTVDVFTTRITPIDRFYIRCHHDVPTLDASAWRLTIDGLVDAPQSLGLAALERLPQHEVESVLQCAGNGRALMQPHVPGVQWTRGAMGNARWRGPRLKDVLALARPKGAAKMLQLAGADRPVLPTTPTFLRGVPLEKARHEDTILALQMNGQPLPRAHGGPARLVMPGWVADGWTKWASTLTLLDGEPKGFFWETAYRYPQTPGAPGAPVPPEQMKPMGALVVKSVIGAPVAGAVHKPGPLTVTGVALSGGGHTIASVEVSVDGGGWRPAPIVDNGGRYGFSVFSLAVDLAPGAHVLRSRATDSAGATQPEAAVWNPSGYLENAVHAVDVVVQA